MFVYKMLCTKTYPPFKLNGLQTTGPCEFYIYRTSGPFRYLHAFNSWYAFLFPFEYSSHRLKILACMVRYTFRCTRCNFLSETNRICSDVSLASWCSSSINRYSGSCPFPCARLLKAVLPPFNIIVCPYSLEVHTPA